VDQSIKIIIPESLRFADFSHVNREFEKGNIKPVYLVNEATQYMCLEWAIPAAITVVVGAFANGFFGEMGKDAYLAFKNGVKKVAIDARLIKVRLIGTKPIDANNKQSKSFCIDTKMSTGENVRLLFNDEGSDKDWERWIDIASSMLAENYLNSDNEMKKKIEHLETPHSSPIFWTFNIEKDEWEPFDMKKSVMLDIERKQNYKR